MQQEIGVMYFIILMSCPHRTQSLFSTFLQLWWVFVCLHSADPSSLALLTVSYTHSNVSNNAETVERDSSYTKLSYENSLETEGSWKISLKVSPQNSHLQQLSTHICLIFWYFGFLFLPLLSCNCAPSANSFQTRNRDIAKSTVNNLTA